MQHDPSPLLERLADGRPTRTFERGDVLFDQGDEAQGLYFLSQGRVRLERHLAQGNALTVGVMRAPSLVAEASLFVERVHCRAVAETRCAATWLPREEVLQLLEDTETAGLFARHLAEEVRELRRRIELRNVRPATERVLSFLRLQADQGRDVTDRPLAAIAAELGLTPEATYRAVRKLELAGKIRRDGRAVFLTET